MSLDKRDCRALGFGLLVLSAGIAILCFLGAYVTPQYLQYMKDVQQQLGPAAFEFEKDRAITFMWYALGFIAFILFFRGLIKSDRRE